MTSPTFLHDQTLLRDFYRLPDGVWLGFRSQFLELYNQHRVEVGWTRINGDAWSVRRNGNWFEFRNGAVNPVRRVVDFSTVAPGQSLTFAFALALTLTLTFTLALALTQALAFSLAFAIDFDIHEAGDSYPHDCYYSWDQFQSTLSGLQGQTAGFTLGEKQNLRMAGRINPNNTVDLVLNDLAPEIANHIFSLLKK